MRDARASPGEKNNRRRFGVGAAPKVGIDKSGGAGKNRKHMVTEMQTDIKRKTKKRENNTERKERESGGGGRRGREPLKRSCFGCCDVNATFFCYWEEIKVQTTRNMRPSRRKKPAGSRSAEEGVGKGRRTAEKTAVSLIAEMTGREKGGTIMRGRRVPGQRDQVT